MPLDAVTAPPLICGGDLQHALRYLTPLSGARRRLRSFKRCNIPTNLDVLHFIRALTAQGEGSGGGEIWLQRGLQDVPPPQQRQVDPR